MEYNYKNIKLAKNLRKNMTKEEVKLWNILKGKSFEGLKFRRQVAIGEYIVDFLCSSNKIVIELDGGQHNEDNNVKYDQTRTKYLEENGYKVIRFWNNDVWNNIEGVIEKLRKILK